MPNSELVQSLLRGVDILELLAQAEDGQRLSEIAGHLGVGPSTAHNLLRTLASRDLVVQEGRRYLPGPGIAALARQAGRRRGYRAIGAVMEELAGRFPQATLTVSEPVGPEVRVRLRMSPDRPGVLQRPGTVFSLYGSISALIIQAYADDERFERMRRQAPYIEFGSHLWASEQALADFLGAIRRDRYGVLPFDTDRMIRLAVPWFDDGQLLLGALGISLPTAEAPPVAGLAAELNEALDAAEFPGSD